MISARHHVSVSFAMPTTASTKLRLPIVDDPHVYYLDVGLMRDPDSDEDGISQLGPKVRDVKCQPIMMGLGKQLGLCRGHFTDPWVRPPTSCFWKPR
jgi:hypothetical protein